MAKNSDIAWTHHTFNPWWGCSKISPGCANCYAERWAARTGFSAIWGSHTPRRPLSESYWRQPLAWNAEAEASGKRPRVFCGSMCDVFEDRSDLDPLRGKLWELIEATPALNWLLLTKRPENAARFLPWTMPPFQVWLGTTIENQAAMARLDPLLQIPARIRFLSCEPLLESISFGDSLAHGIDWVIAGGESGPGFRVMDQNWVLEVWGQCEQAGVPFFFKQWSGKQPPRTAPTIRGRVVQQLPFGEQ